MQIRVLNNRARAVALLSNHHLSVRPIYIWARSTIAHTVSDHQLRPDPAPVASGESAESYEERFETVLRAIKSHNVITKATFSDSLSFNKYEDGTRVAQQRWAPVRSSYILEGIFVFTYLRPLFLPFVFTSLL